MAKTSFLRETYEYASLARSFSAKDWLAYIAWVGLMMGLFAAVTSFVAIGALHGVAYPAYVWNLPVGTGIFVFAIAFDTIGHRTIYKEEIAKAEAVVHHITIFAGITSVLALCLAYQHPLLMRIPALALIILSFVYSLVDEALHWRRYLTQRCDRVESFSHFFIMVGHLIMILTWWTWFDAGYPGVAETLSHLPVL
jgi:hypothetical protein